MKKLLILVLGAAIFIGCGSNQDPIAPTELTLKGDINTELDSDGIESLLAELILSNQNKDLFTYNVVTSNTSSAIRDENGVPLFDQFRMTIIVEGTITAGIHDISVSDIYIDVSPIDVGAFWQEATGNNKLNILPTAIAANSTAEFFLGKRYDVNGAMLGGFTYELIIDAKVAE